MACSDCQTNCYDTNTLLRYFKTNKSNEGIPGLDSRRKQYKKKNYNFLCQSGMKVGANEK